VSATRLDPFAYYAGAWAMMLDELLSAPPTVAGEVIERYVLATPPQVDPTVHANTVAEFVALAQPAVSRRAMPVTVELVARGALNRNVDTDLTIKGFQLYLDGNARAAAELWGRDAGVWGNSFNATIFEAAGADDLAETRYRAFINHGPRGAMSIQAVKLARLLMKRGDVEEARTLAAGFIAGYQQTDVPMPLVAEMKALLKAP
jgi:hypothetical protein